MREYLLVVVFYEYLSKWSFFALSLRFLTIYCNCVLSWVSSIWSFNAIFLYLYLLQLRWMLLNAWRRNHCRLRVLYIFHRLIVIIYLIDGLIFIYCCSFAFSATLLLNFAIFFNYLIFLLYVIVLFMFLLFFILFSRMRIIIILFSCL